MAADKNENKVRSQKAHSGRVKFLLFYVTKILKQFFPPFSKQPWLVAAAPSYMLTKQINSDTTLTIVLESCPHLESRSSDA